MKEFLLTPAGLAICYLIIANLTAFCMMGWDKRQSKRAGARRTPEKRLFLAAVLGGSIGAIVGMFHFHHKTRHWYFRWGLPAILIVQLAAVGGIWYWLRG